MLEKDTLALHHRLSSEGTNVAQAEHCGAVRDHCHQIAPGCVAIDVIRPFGDLTTRIGDPRRVGKRQIPLALERLGGDNLDFPRSTLGVIVECILTANRHSYANPS